MNDTFSKRLKESRENKKISMNDLAKAVGITKGSIWKYEQGEREPKATTAKKISEALNVSFDWLIGISDSKECTSIRVDPDLLITISSSNLPEDAIKQIKSYAAFLLEKHLTGKSKE